MKYLAPCSTWQEMRSGRDFDQPKPTHSCFDPQKPNLATSSIPIITLAHLRSFYMEPFASVLKVARDMRLLRRRDGRGERPSTRGDLVRSRRTPRSRTLLASDGSGIGSVSVSDQGFVLSPSKSDSSSDSSRCSTCPICCLGGAMRSLGRAVEIGIPLPAPPCAI